MWVFLLVAVAALGGLLRTRGQLRYVRAEAAALTTELRASEERTRQAVGHRDALVRAAARIAPNLPAGGLRDSIDLALQAAGVELISADGQRFDARLHRVVQRIPTDDEVLHDVVAATVHRGYREGPHLLRPADVAVHEQVPHPTAREDRP